MSLILSNVNTDLTDTDPDSNDAVLAILTSERSLISMPCDVFHTKLGSGKPLAVQLNPTVSVSLTTASLLLSVIITGTIWGRRIISTDNFHLL